MNLRSDLGSLIGSAALCLATSTLLGQTAPKSTADLRIDTTQTEAHIHPEVYGHFAEHLGRCIYEGIWVGEDSSIPNTRGIRNDVVAALKDLEIPVLRWPGGCFADEYHWKDGIGPREERPAMINTHWGAVVENNHFGTHEFMDLCEMIGTDAYVSGNVGSGTVQEMMEWVEYMTSDADSPMANLRRENGRDKPWELKYFGVGNESWGCGGNMRPEFYADIYRQYNTYVKNYSGNKVYRIACGANGSDYNWTSVLMERAARYMDGLSVHYYTLPTGNWQKKGPATGFDEKQYIDTLVNALHIDEVIGNHAAVMDEFDKEKRVGMIVDEWGIWTDAEPGTNPGFLYQQNSMRDAIIAGLHFNIFHTYADRIRMANIAQTVNVLQAMILTDKEKMIKTPTYWVFHMYKEHQGNDVLPLQLMTGNYKVGDVSIPQVSATASRDPETGAIYISLVNCDTKKGSQINCALEGLTGKTIGSARVLTASAADAHNTFDQPDAVAAKDFKGAKLNGDRLQLDLPPLSVVTVEIR
ncbi:MAG: alpha-N-arabinofuranosidase [Verrucomicrobiota bacterium JB022]|nr:alpha-N-arabinofuranosidase [Verrucomicrobiota bacterium JB022]